MPYTLAVVAGMAHSVVGALATEKVRVRKFGVDYLIDLHVQAAPEMSLHEAHVLSGKVKAAILAVLPTAAEVLIHMEPNELPKGENVRESIAGPAIRS